MIISQKNISDVGIRNILQRIFFQKECTFEFYIRYYFAVELSINQHWFK